MSDKAYAKKPDTSCWILMGLAYWMAGGNLGRWAENILNVLQHLDFP